MSDLRPVHVSADIDPGNKGKIIAGIIVAAGDHRGPLLSGWQGGLVQGHA